MSEKLNEVLSDRQETYGDAKENFARIGRMWGAILNQPDIPPHIVALMFDAAKSIRAVKNPGHDDSWIDKLGYTTHGINAR